MAKLKNKGNDRENLDGVPVFATVRVTYTCLCCNYCGLPMVKSNVYIWKEDKYGKPYNVSFVHYKCQEPFEKTHTGKWFGKGMLSVCIKW